MKGRRTARIEELMLILSQRPWTIEEQREVEGIVGSKQPYEIDGDWSDPGTAKYDRTDRSEWKGDHMTVPVEESPRRPVSGDRMYEVKPGEIHPVPVEVAEYDARLKTLEAAMTDVMRRLKALEEKAGVGPG